MKKPVTGSFKTFFLLFTAERKLAVCLLLFFNPSSLYAQDYKIKERTRIYLHEIHGDSVLLKADNDFVIPVSIRISFELDNLTGETTYGTTAIIPPNSSGNIIAGFRKIIPDSTYTCLYKWKIVLGDTSRLPDPNYYYGYPYPNTLSFKISQGPGGSFSHINTFAYDFDMPSGTSVTAAREGIIALVFTDSDTGGPHMQFIDKANFISILHPDGTIGNYYHLLKDGSLVKEGQKVEKGQVIGFSGNTGYSGGPHLHFEVVRPVLNSGTKNRVSFRWEPLLHSQEF